MLGAVDNQEAEVVYEGAIPTPVGYHLLIAMPTIAETYGDSGLVKSTQTIHNESIMSMVGLVLDVGEQAYQDKERFPTGAWCKKGDYVMFRANSGTRFKVAGQEMRILNDDSIQAVVPKPDAITSIM